MRAHSGRPIDAVVIGASAGAVEAFTQILPLLAEDAAKPIVAVIHIPKDRVSLLPDLFQASCRLTVKEVEDKEPLLGGTVYFAPPDYHVLIEPNRILSLSGEEPVLFSRPSIDVLFETAADVFGDRLIGIVLTGASADGANGLKKICGGGGIGIVQKPETALSPEMPRAALNACPDATAMDLEEIPRFLNRAFQGVGS